MNSQDDHVDFKGKQFRWTHAMERELIKFLVEEVKGGRKVDKGFKKTSYVQAAKAISLGFDVVCNADHVENRMRTIKKKFGEVKKIQLNGSGFGWDETLKKFTCPEDVYKAYVDAHPKAAPYLNKPIEMYEELSMVCGDDQATGSFAKSNSDEHDTLNDGLDNMEINDEFGIEDITSTQAFTQSPDIPTPPTRSHGKRKRVADEYSDQLNKLAEGVADIAAALKSNASQEHVTFLYNEVTKLEGFDESDLEDAFDYLNDNEKIAMAFIAKKDAGKKKWLTKFISEK